MPAPKGITPGPADSSGEDLEVIERCKEATRQAAAFRGPLPPHPAVDVFPLDDWKDMMWIHASHHLGFLIPRK